MSISIAEIEALLLPHETVEFRNMSCRITRLGAVVFEGPLITAMMWDMDRRKVIMTKTDWYWCGKHEWWSDEYEAAHCQRSTRQFPHPTMDGCDKVDWWCPQEMCVDTRPGPRLAGPMVEPAKSRGPTPRILERPRERNPLLDDAMIVRLGRGAGRGGEGVS